MQRKTHVCSPKYKTLIILVLASMPQCSASQSGIHNLHTIDQNKPKVGILSLSATKILPFVQSSYTLENLSAEEFNSMRECLHDAGYVADNYREWLKSAEIQIIPVLFFRSLKEISDLMDHLDGFVLTGGSESFYKYEGYHSLYLSAVEHILEKAKEINDGGRVFPIWGTCLGFEALVVAESGETLKRRQVMNHMKLRERVQVVDNSLRSTQFFTEKELDDMEDIPLLYFNHMWGLSRWDIQHLPELRDKVKIGAKINTDKHRNVAVWMEFVHYPFFGTQFHPEKAPMSGANPFDQKRDEQVGIEEKKDDQDAGDTEDMQPEVLGDYMDGSKKERKFFNFRQTKEPSEKSDEENSEAFFFEKGNDKKGKKSDKRKKEKSVKNGKEKENMSMDSEDSSESESERMENVHVAIENKELKERNKEIGEDEGVDSIAPPIVSDPSLISPEYLQNVRKINEKFARFFASFVKNGKFKVNKKFLEKQMYWLENIGSYYQVNVIRNEE